LISDQYLSFTATPPGGIPVVCYFYKPGALDQPAIPTAIGEEYAIKISTIVAERIQAMRVDNVRGLPPVPSAKLAPVLELLRHYGIKPLGEFYIVSQVPHGAAGMAISPTRHAITTAEGAENLEILIHEMVHLASNGDRDHMAVMLSEGFPMTPRYCGWHITADLITGCDSNGKFTFKEDRTYSRGIFFEEATAELVPQSLALQTNFKYFGGTTRYTFGDKTIEVPGEFGENVAAWGMMMLNDKCPGVVEILLDGARGNVDYPRLKSAIENRYPGLFERLYRFTRELKDHRQGRELAIGTISILEALGKG
jgi:hypothetical protein